MQRTEYVNSYGFWPSLYQGSWSTGDFRGSSGGAQQYPQTGTILELSTYFQNPARRLTMTFEDALMWGISPLMDNLAELAYKNAGGRTASTGYCLRAVRQALTGMGLTNAATLGAWARDAVEYFRSHEGFVEITGLDGKGVPMLPRGTIVIYNHPTKPDWSHAQIMLGYDAAVSDYVHDSRVYNNNQIGDVWGFIPIGNGELGGE